MAWLTYIDGVRLDARTWYYLQRVDDDLGVHHLALRSVSGKFLHPSEEAAREGAQLAEPTEVKPPYITDLDAALAWAGAPTTPRLDCDILMMAWHALIELGALESPVDLDALTESPLEEAFHRLHVCSAYRDDPAQSPEPLEWTAEELALVAKTIYQGIEQLRALVSSLGDR